MREEHLVQEMNRCDEAEETLERGLSKNSKHEGQKKEGWRRRTQDVQTRRSMPRIERRWKNHRLFDLQLPHSPLVGVGLRGGRFIGMGMEMSFNGEGFRVLQGRVR